MRQLTPLVVSEAAKDDYWILVQPLIWEIDGKIWEVESGFYTDLASIPRLLRNLPAFDVNGPSRKIAPLHDKFYRSHEVTRRYADAVLRRGMVTVKAGLVTAWMYWVAVRLFGLHAWKAKRAFRLRRKAI